MIAIIANILYELGLIDNSRASLPYYVRLLGNLNFIVFINKECFYQVKFSNCQSLTNEFNALNEVYSIMPRNIPRPIACINSAGYQVMVCEGVDHVPLNKSTALNYMPLIIGQIKNYLDVTTKSSNMNNVSHNHYMAAMLAADAISDKGLRDKYRQRIEQLRSILDKLPSIKQHGDFAINNFGVKDGSLIFFDWEDYARITIPGFDITILMLSLEDFDLEVFQKLIYQPKSMVSQIIQHFCYTTDIKVEDYADLVPLYLLYFLHLKEKYGYGANIISRIEGLLYQYFSKYPV